MRQQKELKLYYWRSKNFGDKLNEYIFEKCFNVKVKYTDSSFASAIGIGSILDRTLLTIKDLPKFLLSKILFLNKPMYILSSGIPETIEFYKKKDRFFRNAILKRKLIPIALRGKKTKNELEKLLNKKFDDVVLGDFGILASKLLEEKQEKIYDLGICPHYAQKDSPIFKKILEEIPNSVILDVEEDVFEFLKKVAQCKTLISTGMHPLIAADSFNIPNMWITIVGFEKDIVSYKIPDYYSALDVENQMPVDIREQKITPEFIIENYKVKKEKVIEVQEKLLKAIGNVIDKI